MSAEGGVPGPEGQLMKGGQKGGGMAKAGLLRRRASEKKKKIWVAGGQGWGRGVHNWRKERKAPKANNPIPQRGGKSVCV